MLYCPKRNKLHYGLKLACKFNALKGDESGNNNTFIKTENHTAGILVSSDCGENGSGTFAIKTDAMDSEVKKLCPDGTIFITEKGGEFAKTCI